MVVCYVRPSATEPEHEHADLRYFLATGNPDAIAPENEDSPLRWLALDEARELVGGNNLRHTLDRAERPGSLRRLFERRGVGDGLSSNAQQRTAVWVSCAASRGRPAPAAQARKSGYRRLRLRGGERPGPGEQLPLDVVDRLAERPGAPHGHRAEFTRGSQQAR